MLCLKDNDFKFFRSCSLIWAQALKQLVNASVAMLMSGIFGGGWAGMVGLSQSHANLAMTSGQGTLNLWGFGAKH